MQDGGVIEKTLIDFNGCPAERFLNSPYNFSSLVCLNIPLGNAG